MLFTYQLYQFLKDCSALSQPQQCPFTHLKMFRITCLHISFVQRVEPSAFAMLITWKRLCQTSVLFLGKRPQKFNIMGGRSVVAQS
ncbi:hypothetical protein GV67_00025 [Pseudorhizobium pelagicum]|uniref:Uncharacterized protein n=1 Tax=Pseudorhizobium pelagicum TaxID=1509405 RepID=A0A922T7P7_9HYPH|nr:hypothetical protein GV68_02980 [Pseudorhizobium pelagicum]KEQ09113.1 hypothetical protein GV67_00025 [Pseudorhizobium pelagicum]